VVEQRSDGEIGLSFHWGSTRCKPAV